MGSKCPSGWLKKDGTGPLLAEAKCVNYTTEEELCVYYLELNIPKTKPT